MAVDGQTYSCAFYCAVHLCSILLIWMLSVVIVCLCGNLKAAFYSYSVFVYCKKDIRQGHFSEPGLSTGFSPRLLSHSPPRNQNNTHRLARQACSVG